MTDICVYSESAVHNDAMPQDIAPAAPLEHEPSAFGMAAENGEICADRVMSADDGDAAISPDNTTPLDENETAERKEKCFGIYPRPCLPVICRPAIGCVVPPIIPLCPAVVSPCLPAVGCVFPPFVDCCDDDDFTICAPAMPVAPLLAPATLAPTVCPSIAAAPLCNVQTTTTTTVSNGLGMGYTSSNVASSTPYGNYHSSNVNYQTPWGGQSSSNVVCNTPFGGYHNSQQHQATPYGTYSSSDAGCNSLLGGYHSSNVACNTPFGGYHNSQESQATPFGGFNNTHVSSSTPFGNYSTTTTSAANHNFPGVMMAMANPTVAAGFAHNGGLLRDLNGPEEYSREMVQGDAATAELA